ncbi:hypothetical protein C2S51_028946 [Perilla frutescens var. frutescens]|nr:hypothetical protein C2S51_028946 [Perilla frutescens var. frutescens]
MLHDRRNTWAHHGITLSIVEFAEGIERTIHLRFQLDFNFDREATNQEVKTSILT